MALFTTLTAPFSCDIVDQSAQQGKKMNTKSEISPGGLDSSRLTFLVLCASALLLAALLIGETGQAAASVPGGGSGAVRASAPGEPECLVEPWECTGGETTCMIEPWECKTEEPECLIEPWECKAEEPECLIEPWECKTEEPECTVEECQPLPTPEEPPVVNPGDSASTLVISSPAPESLVAPDPRKGRCDRLKRTPGGKGCTHRGSSAHRVCGRRAGVARRCIRLAKASSAD